MGGAYIGLPLFQIAAQKALAQLFTRVVLQHGPIGVHAVQKLIFSQAAIAVPFFFYGDAAGNTAQVFVAHAHYAGEYTGAEKAQAVLPGIEKSGGGFERKPEFFLQKILGLAL